MVILMGDCRPAVPGHTSEGLTGSFAKHHSGGVVDLSNPFDDGIGNLFGGISTELTVTTEASVQATTEHTEVSS